MNRDPCHLAQFNIARLSAPLDSPRLKEFVDFLDPVNRLAEESPGFVWRLKDDQGQSSTYLPPAYADAMIITNLTVWQDVESLRAFTYHTVHSYFLRSRRKWFDQLPGRQVVLWWIPQGHLPTLAEAKERLQHLQDHGSTPAAFTFQDAFDSHGQPLARPATRPLGDELAAG